MSGSPISRWPSLAGLDISTDTYTQPWWDAAAERRLVAQLCGACGTARMPPTPFCPACRSQEMEWRELSGRGAIYSYTIVTHASSASRQAESVPYVPALIEPVELPEIRFIANVVDAPLDQIEIGREVEVAWRDDGEGPAYPGFRLVETSGA